MSLSDVNVCVCVAFMCAVCVLQRVCVSLSDVKVCVCFHVCCLCAPVCLCEF